ncbi:hypothetical protein HZQ67_11610 [Elizabethkingia anophelis]|nr:hypothetical protein [Elizabethkingia anophelis]MDV3499155.1 hypothetical protein [Elizabethkingia anophelis]
MTNKLNDFLSLNGSISNENDDSFIYTIRLKEEDIEKIEDFDSESFIERITDSQKKIIIVSDLATYKNQTILIEFVTSELKKIGFYLTIQEFILSNRLEILPDFYINETSSSNLSQSNNEDIEKYKAVTTLIENLTSKAKFISEEHSKIICLVQDNFFIEIPIDTIIYEEFLEHKNIDLINQYIADINSYKEKRIIYLKELIDFLTSKTRNERFNELIINFEEFYDKCNTSFEYYLSNFSFNKIKLELDNSVLEYSKNIRSIINDSQSKLIAIPAAFILGVSQIDFANPFLLKNALIVASAFLFSYILSIFIKNQENAIEIISDNLNNHKTNYERSKATQFEEEKELKSLSELIKKSYGKTEIEIQKQEKRLKILQYCNWGISIALLISIGVIALMEIDWDCLFIKMNKGFIQFQSLIYSIFKA